MADTAAIIAMAKVWLSSSSSLLADEAYDEAVAAAVTELGWTMPTDNPAQIQWLVKRTIRHCNYILWLATAQKFKYKQVNLQQRFEHYKAIIKQQDTEFSDAQDDDPTFFVNVDSFKLFGDVIGAGFNYDAVGRDITYLLTTGD